MEQRLGIIFKSSISKRMLFHLKTDSENHFFDYKTIEISIFILFRNGSLLATTCKDKKLRIIDPRNGDVLRMGDSHQGTKASKVTKNFCYIQSFYLSTKINSGK